MNKTIHGGSWSYLPGRCRSAARGGGEPGFQHCFIGFRLCKKALSKDTFRVLRGGAFLGGADGVRCAYRSSNLPYYRFGGRGFRLMYKGDSNEFQRKN
jgi:formylglycine-generating enzyme required for sulfatase activity